MGKCNWMLVAYLETATVMCVDITVVCNIRPDLEFYIPVSWCQIVNHYYLLLV